MQKFGRVLSLIVCFQLAWGCSPAPTSSSSSGPANGFVELSGSVDLAFTKVLEVLIPSAAADGEMYTKAKSVSSQFSAEGMAAYIVKECGEEAAAAVADTEAAVLEAAPAVDAGVKTEIEKPAIVANLMDLTDPGNPCRIMEIKLKTSSSEATVGEYKIDVAADLVQDKILAIVYVDEEKGFYGNALLNIDVSDRKIQQHINKESSAKAEIVGGLFQKEFDGVEISDEVKSQMKVRYKELKINDDFGFDFLGDKEKMIALLQDPAYKDELIAALIEARQLKEADGESNSDEVSAAYSSVVSIGQQAAIDGKIALDDFIKLSCSLNHAFVAKRGEKNYAIKFASSNSDAFKIISDKFGLIVEDGRATLIETYDQDQINNTLSKFFYISHSIMNDLATKITLKLFVSDPESKEPERSCIVEIAPPTFNVAAIESFNFKIYENYDNALKALQVHFDNLTNSLTNKFLLYDGSVTEQELELSNSQILKAESIMTAMRVKIFEYFKYFYASQGLGIDLRKLIAFDYKAYKTHDEAYQGLSDVWTIVYSAFETNVKKKLEAKEISESEYNDIMNFEIGLGKQQHSKTYNLIMTYFHTLNVGKGLAIDLTVLNSFDFKSLQSSKEAHADCGAIFAKSQDLYKQNLYEKLKAEIITPEEFDSIYNFEMDYANRVYWDMYNQIDEYYSSVK